MTTDTIEVTSFGWDYGVPRRYIQDLVEYWRDGYDWGLRVARLNEYPQFVTTIDGQRVHFVHVRSPEPDALPLICTRGWPMSVFEYLDLIGPLSNPRAHGAEAGDAFDLVIPSIPGVAFSGPTTDRGWNRSQVICGAIDEVTQRAPFDRADDRVEICQGTRRRRAGVAGRRTRGR